MANKKDEHPSITFLKWLCLPSKYGRLEFQVHSSNQPFFIPVKNIDSGFNIPEIKTKDEIFFSPITRMTGSLEPFEVLALWVHIPNGDKENERISRFTLLPSCTVYFENGVDLFWKLYKDPRKGLPSTEEEVRPYLEKIDHWFGVSINQKLRLPNQEAKVTFSKQEYDLKDFDPFLEEETFQQGKIEINSTEVVMDHHLIEKSTLLVEDPKTDIPLTSSNEGWIKLHRKLLDNSIFRDSETLHLFIYLLLKANHKPYRFLFNKKEIFVERGQLITGIRKISKETGISEWKIRDRLVTLENLKITTRKTTHDFSTITICNYKYYQGTDSKEPHTKPHTEYEKDGVGSKSHTDHTPTTTIQECKDIKNNGRSKKKETDPRVLEFINYWEETFKQETGKPYLINYGKDGDLVKKMFEAGHSLEDIQCYAKTAFKDEQCQRRGLTIGIFSQELNRLVGLRAMNPLERARRKLSRALDDRETVTEDRES